MFPEPDSVAAHAREHAWKYFELHANQRIAVFNFFLILSGTLTAGIAATLQGSQRFSALGIGLGVLLAMVSFVFWKLDQRVSFLIKHAEEALWFVEGTFPTPTAQLFRQEPQKTAASKLKSSLWGRMWTYGEVFRLIFGAMAITGILGATLCVLRFSGYIQWESRVSPNPPPSGLPTAASLTAVEAFHLQTECVALGQKIDENNPHGSALTQSEVAKYVPSKNRCFVELTIQHADLTAPVLVNNGLYDGQTGEMLAFAKIENGKKSGIVFGDPGGLGYERASEYIENTMSGK